MKNLIYYSSIVALLLSGCHNEQLPKEANSLADSITNIVVQEEIQVPARMYHTVEYDVPIRYYFEYLDSLIAKLDTTIHYKLNEHLLVHANPWIIDTLAQTDYYLLMERGIFEEDPQSLIALHQGDSLLIPDSLETEQLKIFLQATSIDVNIPEFKLRILEGDEIRYTFPIRVGQNKARYLAMAGREVNMQTRTGVGTIYRINKNPSFINPRDNKVYQTTSRDDGRRTKLPRIPWIEPELNGQRHGQLIHPTTNPKTLGKAYSNGCVGMREADMWRVYYHAPLGTKVVFRYELDIINEVGDSVRLKHIYPHYSSKKTIAASIIPKENTEYISICDCGQVEQQSK